MLSTRYHLLTLISIFFALGIGIMIGGAVGTGWVDATQQSVVNLLLEKYDDQVQENRQLSQRIDYMQAVGRLAFPALEEQLIVGLCPDQQQGQTEHLAWAIEAEGGIWRTAGSWDDSIMQQADAILVCGKQADKIGNDQPAFVATRAGDSVLLEIDDFMLQRDDPGQVAALLQKLHVALEGVHISDS